MTSDTTDAIPSPSVGVGPGGLSSRVGRRASRGFTLLEVMIAVFIIGVGFTSLLALHAKNIGSTIRDQQLTRAVLYARELVSELQFQAKIKGVDSLSSTSGNLEQPGFRFEVEISRTELDEVMLATVRVVFDERAPRACEVIYYVHG